MLIGHENALTFYLSRDNIYLVKSSWNNTDCEVVKLQKLVITHFIKDFRVRFLKEIVSISNLIIEKSFKIGKIA